VTYRAERATEVDVIDDTTSDDASGSGSSIVEMMSTWLEHWHTFDAIDGTSLELSEETVEVWLGDEAETSSRTWTKWWPVLKAFAALVSTFARTLARLQDVAASRELDGASERILTDEALADLETDIDRLREAFPGWVEAYVDLEVLDAHLHRAARDPERRQTAGRAVERLSDGLDSLIERSFERIFDDERGEPLEPERVERFLTLLDRVLEEWVERWLYSKVIEGEVHRNETTRTNE
jgi:hypothetical protein